MPLFGIHYTEIANATRQPPLPFDQWTKYDYAGPYASYTEAQEQCRSLDRRHQREQYDANTREYKRVSSFRFLPYKIPEAEDWLARETARIEAKEYEPLPEHMRPEGSNYAWMFPRLVEQENEKKIAFYESERDARYDRLTTVKPTRYFSGYFDEGDMWDHMAELGLAAAGCTLAFARSRKAIRFVYENGPESCMSAGAGQYYCDAVHPVEAYASPDLELAYMYRGPDPTKSGGSDGMIVSRALCNRKTKEYVRIYGDTRRMQKMLEEKGYKENSYCLGGCRLLKIYGKSGNREQEHIVMTPYLDGSCTRMQFLPRDKYMTIIEQPIQLQGNTSGYASI